MGQTRQNKMHNEDQTSHAFIASLWCCSIDSSPVISVMPWLSIYGSTGWLNDQQQSANQWIGVAEQAPFP